MSVHFMGNGVRVIVLGLILTDFSFFLTLKEEVSLLYGQLLLQIDKFMLVISK